MSEGCGRDSRRPVGVQLPDLRRNRLRALF